MMLLYLVIAAQLLFGCWIIQPVESGNHSITRHSLPPNRLVSIFGSKMDASCSSMNDNVCGGTSVLNDGHIPALHEISSNQASLWATELFTLQRRGRIILSFEVDSDNHDRMKLAVFNCPLIGVRLPSVNVYFDSSFRPDRSDSELGNLILQSQLMNTSCDRLLVFCVQYSQTGVVSPTRYINLEFPPSNITNSSYVFLGEVTFLNGGSAPCDLTMPIAITGPIIVPTQGTDGTSTDTPSSDRPQTDTSTIIIAIVVVIVLILIVIVVVIIILVLFIRLRKHKQKHKVQQLQSVVLETKEEEKEAESYMDNQYDVIDKPPQNGVKTAPNNVAVMDALYSNPDEAITDDTYSRLRDSQKKKSTPHSTSALSNEYSKLNRSQTDPVVQKSRRSPAPQKSDADVGIMYAVPDMKKKGTFKAPTIPEKSLELVQYLDTKDAGATNHSLINGTDLPEYSEIGAGDRPSSSVGPVQLSNSAAHTLVTNLDSNPIYHPTDIVPGQATTVTQTHTYDGVLETNAIYSEPLPPNKHEPEWNPDQNIYEAIYSEPLQPSLFMQEREEVDTEDLRPYTSIYTAPIIPTTEKPLLVTYRNIKEISSLGNGNFGDVVLAQTVGLTPSQLRLEDDVSYTLVAVKKLKENASDRNRQLFEKEVKFMSRLDHPNVIRLLGVCMDEVAPFIMMEYMTNGDLNQYLKGFHMQDVGLDTYSNVKPVETSTLIYMSTQIASAMQYLASQNFVHRDLATRNCLVGSKDTIKVSDFGMSRSLYESQYYVISGHAILPIRWMATECFFGKFSAKTDVWAFGVTMWEIFMLGKEQPYYQLQDQDVVEDAVRGPDRILLERPSKCPKDVYEIMKRCWTYDPSQRPTFDELYALLYQLNQ